MNCRKIKRIINTGKMMERESRAAIESHIAGCELCRSLAIHERLATLLIESRIDECRRSDTTEFSPFIMARIRNRIRELSDQGLGWESAVLGLRGWLLAFSTAAIIMLSLSIQWQLSAVKAAPDHDTELSSISDINEVLITENIVR